MRFVTIPPLPRSEVSERPVDIVAWSKALQKIELRSKISEKILRVRGKISEKDREKKREKKREKSEESTSLTQGRFRGICQVEVRDEIRRVLEVSGRFP